MSESVVAKFGGTSMAQPDLVEAIVTSRADQRIIVPSAPGKLPGDTEKMTDLLLDYNKLYVAEKPQQYAVYDQIMDRFTTIFAHLPSGEANELSHDLNRDLSQRAHDRSFIASRGEHFSARALAFRLGAHFIDSHDFHFGDNGEFDPVASRPALQLLGCLSVGQRLVVPGFYGFGSQGEVHLFDRGGSDRTGAILAAANGWDYENWTDKPGIFSVDDRIIPEAQPLEQLSREEVREGAHGGTGVLQGDTIIDLQGSDCVVTVKSTFDPAAPGTRILPHREAEVGRPIVALSGRDDIWEVTIRDMGMAGRKKYGALLLDKFGDLGLSLEHMPSAQDAFTITTVAPSGKEEKAAFETSINEFADFAKERRLSSEGTVVVSQKGVVYAVGEGLRDPRTRNLAKIRILSDILTAGYTSEDDLSHHTSPSLGFLVRPETVNPIIRVIYDREIAHTKS